MPFSAYVQAGLFVVAAAAALFAAAGTVAIPGFWAYLAILAAVITISFATLDSDLLRERSLVREWCPLDWAEEKGQITAGVGPFIEQEARRNKAFVNREQFPTRGDKSVRAQSIRGRMSIDGLYVPTSAPWFTDFRAELLSFPARRHDDQVDALGLVGPLLDVMVDGRHPPKREPKQPKSGYSTYEVEKESWKVY